MHAVIWSEERNLLKSQQFPSLEFFQHVGYYKTDTLGVLPYTSIITSRNPYKSPRLSSRVIFLLTSETSKKVGPMDIFRDTDYDSTIPSPLPVYGRLKIA